MRIAAHLCTSRHGVFYFRWPLPRHLHPAGKATDIKVSLGTRLPHIAEQLSRLMVIAGQALSFPASLRSMRYDAIRQHVQDHFRGQLAAFKGRVAEVGPDGSNSRESFETALAIAESPLDDFMAVHCTGTGPNMLASFLDQRGLDHDLPAATIRNIATELQKAYRSVLTTALGHGEALQTYDFEDRPVTAPTAQAIETPNQVQTSEPLKDVARQYIAEGQRTGQWRAKTISEKTEALELLQELVGNKPVSALDKADARKAKEALLKLPKNRSKNPAIRNLSLQAALDATGVERMSGRTINSYLSHFQSFTEWSVKQGHCKDNPFKGLRVSTKTAASPRDRKAFTPEQMQTMYIHLTDNPDDLVTKDDHQWPTLIGMFTGARLNEIAQLRPEDVIEKDGVWCFDLNDTDGKALKNKGSRRHVPIHRQLLDTGILDFVELRRKEGETRLFPSLTYSAQNGYGRNIGRWFNESFLPNLGMKDKGLVFHCLRHTMITRLLQADAPDAMVKALVGHSQVGVTHKHYATEGYKIDQLQREINKFAF